MAVAPGVNIDIVGAVFAKAARDQQLAREAWVSARHDEFDLWLLTEPMTLAEERELYGIVDRLYERFPGTDFRLHILNPATFEHLDAANAVPHDARRLGLRPTA